MMKFFEVYIYVYVLRSERVKERYPELIKMSDIFYGGTAWLRVSKFFGKRIYKVMARCG